MLCHDPEFRLHRHAVVETRPFRHVWFGVGSLIPAEQAARLVAQWPDHLLRKSERCQGSDKTYRVRAVEVYRAGRWAESIHALDDEWRRLLRALVTSSYVQEMSGLLGLDVGPADLELRLTEYGPGHWMSRHTDRAPKAFSHNIYFCPEWRREWGGELALYAGHADRDPVARYMPGAGTSVAFARSVDSWHEVLPVSLDCGRPRRALLVHAYASATGEAETRACA